MTNDTGAHKCQRKSVNQILNSTFFVDNDIYQNNNENGKKGKKANTKCQPELNGYEEMIVILFNMFIYMWSWCYFGAAFFALLRIDYEHRVLNGRIFSVSSTLNPLLGNHLLKTHYAMSFQQKSFSEKKNFLVIQVHQYRLCFAISAVFCLLFGEVSHTEPRKMGWNAFFR